MTKISGISESIQSILNKKVNRPGTDQFKTSLKSALTDKDGVSGTSKNTAAGPLGEVKPPLFVNIEPSPDIIQNNTQLLIDRLDKYVKDLGNPLKTLKELETDITDIKTSANQLSAEVEKMQGQHTELKDIVRQFAVTANVEYLKFQRGDYI